MSQQDLLNRPFPSRLVKTTPDQAAADYVEHGVITAYLNAIVPGWSFEHVDTVVGDIPEMQTKRRTYPARVGVTGAVWRLVADVDGAQRIVDEVGTADNPAMRTDAENLKLAASDALKRCAMRLGLGLHLWTQGAVDQGELTAYMKEAVDV